MIRIEKTVDSINDIDLSHYYFIEFITDNKYDLISDSIKEHELHSKGNIVLDNTSNVIYIIYPSDSYMYIDEVESRIVELRNFLSSTKNIDFLKTNKIATIKKDLSNRFTIIPWDRISVLYTKIFEYTNAELLIITVRES